MGVTELIAHLCIVLGGVLIGAAFGALVSGLAAVGLVLFATAVAGLLQTRRSPWA